MISSRRYYYIDSRSRLEGTDSKFSYSIPIPKDTDAKFTHVAILNAVIPKSYYLVRAGRNTFHIIENGVTSTVTIPAGNYSRRSFQAVLQAQLNLSSSQGWTYAITYPNTSTEADTGKYTYNVTNNGGLQPSFVFTTNVFEQLGFNQNTTYNFAGDTLTSANVIKMQQEDALFIHSDIASNGVDSVLQELYSASTVTFGNVIYNNPDPISNSKQLTTQNNNVYHFSLTDESSELIELNGLNIVFTLMVFTIDDVYKLIRNVANRLVK